MAENGPGRGPPGAIPADGTGTKGQAGCSRNPYLGSFLLINAELKSIALCYLILLKWTFSRTHTPLTCILSILQTFSPLVTPQQLRAWLYIFDNGCYADDPELFTLNGSLSVGDSTLGWWWGFWQIYCQAGIGGDDEPHKCTTILFFHSLLVSLHLVVTSPLCPLVQFSIASQEQSSAVILPHGGTSRNTKEKTVKMY